MFEEIWQVNFDSNFLTRVNTTTSFMSHNGTRNIILLSVQVLGNTNQPYTGRIQSNLWLIVESIFFVDDNVDVNIIFFNK